MRIGVISGGFDPIHKGHINYIKDAKMICDYLVVGVNTHDWLVRKKGRAFMPYDDRKAIVQNIIDVDDVIDFNDDDNTAFDLIKKVSELWQTGEIVFMNGGDRTKDNIPEMAKCKEAGLECKFEFGVGGTNKANSSSWILESWDKPKTPRPWGWYRVLDDQSTWAVKELTVDVDHSLSDQKHKHRDEHWHVVYGQIHIDIEHQNGDKHTVVVSPGESFNIPKETWHRAYNKSNKPAKVIEVWLGDRLSEQDIERRG